ncbi:MAG: hypothetical protein K8F91_11815, partial [Candidatus Obscuribacterales bacterium]|nr:hypothetical protein [Candidatus Obscuribacterales bacterium]
MDKIGSDRVIVQIIALGLFIIAILDFFLAMYLGARLEQFLNFVLVLVGFGVTVVLLSLPVYAAIFSIRRFHRLAGRSM